VLDPIHQGFAKETDDADVVTATMSKPGVVLNRPAGSSGSFAEHSDLPADLADDGVGARLERTRSKAKKRPPPKISEGAARKAALEFEREQKRREAERQQEEASRERERERREKAVAKVQAALDEAREMHEAKTSAIEAERAAVDKRAEDEEARWEKQKEKLQTALRRRANRRLEYAFPPKRAFAMRQNRGNEATLSSAKEPTASERAIRDESPGHCERAGLGVFQRDLLGQHDVPDRQLAHRHKTQSERRMAALIELADIRHSARMDPVPLAGVAADDLETALFGELLPLARRQPLPQQP
jgi:hypothetical protein